MFGCLILPIADQSRCSRAEAPLEAARDLFEKPRVIATQDGEVDDKSSMIRFLMYSSDYEIVGIVENNSIFQKRGHSKERWIQKQIGLYAQVFSNLKLHHPGYPSPEYLSSILYIGNENPADLLSAPADMQTKDTPASDLIIKTLLDGDPRPVHVPAWGGANTIAYALWKIKTTMPDRWALAAARIRIYAICYNLTNKAQDGGIRWIVDNLPEVKLFQSAAWSRTWNYSSVGERSFNPAEVQEYMSENWLNLNVKNGHGPLGESYPQRYVSEGDTPCFLPLINNGLNADKDFTFGGWGGRAKILGGNFMVDAADDAPLHPEHKSFWRWIPAAQNDFAARMDWCLAENYADANHNPQANLAGPRVRSVVPGQTISLDASTSTDPDGDQLDYNWWHYHEADSAEAKLNIRGAKTASASFTVPMEPGKQLHIILEVTDNGTPPLKHYQRIICNIL